MSVIKEDCRPESTTRLEGLPKQLLGLAGLLHYFNYFPQDLKT